MAEECRAITICIKSAGHEELDDIKGGDDNGYYHLTDEEYNLMQGILEGYRDELAEEDTFHKLRDDEYTKLTDMFSLLYPDDEDTDFEKALNALIDARIQQYVAGIIDGGKINPQQTGAHHDRYFYGQYGLEAG